VSTYVVDRAFRAVDGARWVVDYKPAGMKAATSMPSLIAERERYREQLKAYGQALQSSSAGLYFRSARMEAVGLLMR